MRVIFIYGPAAAGKLTIAKRLSTATGFALYHNHLVVDALTAVFPFGSEPFVNLREQFWLVTLAEAAKMGRSMVFTFTPEPTVSPEFPTNVQRLVEMLGGHVHFVQLVLSHEGQEKRIENEDRAEFRKLRSLDVLREIRLESQGWQPSMPTPDLEIDSEKVEPDLACNLIVERFNLGGEH